jgi:hypothetical protein
MKTYRVLMSESVAKWVLVKAGSPDKAKEIVEQGYFLNENITNEECLDRSIESVEVVDDE